MHLRVARWFLFAISLAASSVPAFAAGSYSFPYILNFAPTSGAPGTVITVHGSGFTGLNSAWIGGGHNSSVYVVSDSEVKVTVPTDATTGQLALLNPANAAWSPNSFNVAKSGARVGRRTVFRGRDKRRSGMLPGTPSAGAVDLEQQGRVVRCRNTSRCLGRSAANASSGSSSTPASTVAQR